MPISFAYLNNLLYSHSKLCTLAMQTEWINKIYEIQELGFNLSEKLDLYLSPQVVYLSFFGLDLMRPKADHPYE